MNNRCHFATCLFSFTHYVLKINPCWYINALIHFNNYSTTWKFMIYLPIFPLLGVYVLWSFSLLLTIFQAIFLLMSLSTDMLEFLKRDHCIEGICIFNVTSLGHNIWLTCLYFYGDGWLKLFLFILLTWAGNEMLIKSTRVHLFFCLIFF